ncbi:hypothetical protein MMC17_007485 [Xylographa soralifera]|nr:hypothetical protein [Xylographa soralifera]
MALELPHPSVRYDGDIELESISGDSVGSSGYTTPPERPSTPNTQVYQSPPTFTRLPLLKLIVYHQIVSLASAISFPPWKSIMKCAKFAALFIVALVVVPPAFSAMLDGRKSARLAGWGAMVTYRQACLNLTSITSQCEELLNRPLDPPPDVDLLHLSKRFTNGHRIWEDRTFLKQRHWVFALVNAISILYMATLGLFYGRQCVAVLIRFIQISAHIVLSSVTGLKSSSRSRRGQRLKSLLVSQGFRSDFTSLLSATPETLLPVAAQEIRGDSSAIDYTAKVLNFRRPVNRGSSRAGTLLEAASAGSIAAVQEQLSLGTNPDIYYGIWPNYPLLAAVRGNHLATVQLLLHSGANPDISTEFSLTRQQVWQFQKLEDEDQLLRARLNDLHSTYWRGNRRKTSYLERSITETALHITVGLDQGRIAKALIVAGANIEAPRDDGQTPLHVASLEGSTRSVEILIAHGANPNTVDANSQTPLHLALRESHDVSADHLIRAGANVNAKNRDGVTPLMIVCRRHIDMTVEIQRWLADSPARTCRDENSDETVNNKKLEPKIDPVNFPEGISEDSLLKDETPETSNAYSQPRQLSSDISSDCELAPILHLLVRSGANVDDVNEQGQSLLHMAVIGAHFALVDFLISRGANVNVQDISGQTPLHHACRVRNVAIAKLLLGSRIDTEILTHNGKTALHIAVELGDIALARLLLLYGANIDAPFRSRSLVMESATLRGWTDIASYLLDSGSTLHLGWPGMTSPLYIAVKRGDQVLVQFLLKHSASPRLGRIPGSNDPQLSYTPLGEAIASHNVDIARLLVQHGENVRSVLGNGSTHLWNCMSSDPQTGADMIDFLLEGGVDVNKKNDDGETVIYAARVKGYPEFAEYPESLNAAKEKMD